MMQDRSYETRQAQKKGKKLLILISLTQFISLLFFTLISKLEMSDSSDILENPNGILALATTVIFSILTIYEVFILNHSLLKVYIGNARLRTYLYPIGRKKFFQNRLSAYLVCYAKVFCNLLLIMNGGYLILMTIIDSSFSLGIGNLLATVGLIFFTFFVSIITILVSLLLGFLYQSTNVSLITSVISIALIGNLVVSSYNINVLFLSLMIIVLGILIFILKNRFLYSIEKDELV